MPDGRGATPLRASDPRAVGPYTLLGRLGQGGMGAVYLAVFGSGPLVALKLIRPELAEDGQFLARFAREVAAARRVAGFCTARVLEADLDVDPPYLVTEYVEGVPLDRALAERGALSGSMLEGLAVGVTAALTAIHGVGIVHRDLKPSNVILSLSGPRVIDFGIARALDETTVLTRTGMAVGTPAFTAPEQFAGGEVTTAVDVFAWGGLVAYAGTGRLPFGESALPVLAFRIMSGEPDLEGLPGSLRPLVEAAMHKDPAHRPSARALLLELLGDTARGADPSAVVTQVVEHGWSPPVAAVGLDRPTTAAQVDGWDTTTFALGAAEPPADVLTATPPSAAPEPLAAEPTGATTAAPSPSAAPPEPLTAAEPAGATTAAPSPSAAAPEPLASFVWPLALALASLVALVVGLTQAKEPNGDVNLTAIWLGQVQYRLLGVALLAAVVCLAWRRARLAGAGLLLGQAAALPAIFAVLAWQGADYGWGPAFQLERAAGVLLAAAAVWALVELAREPLVRRATGTGSVALAAVVGTVAAVTALLHSFTGFSWSPVVEVAVVAAGLSVGVAAGLVLPRRLGAGIVTGWWLAWVALAAGAVAEHGDGGVQHHLAHLVAVGALGLLAAGSWVLREPQPATPRLAQA